MKRFVSMLRTTSKFFDQLGSVAAMQILLSKFSYQVFRWLFPFRVKFRLGVVWVAPSEIVLRRIHIVVEVPPLSPKIREDLYRQNDSPISESDWWSLLCWVECYWSEADSLVPRDSISQSSDSILLVLAYEYSECWETKRLKRCRTSAILPLLSMSSLILQFEL